MMPRQVFLRRFGRQSIDQAHELGNGPDHALELVMFLDGPTDREAATPVDTTPEEADHDDE